MEKYTNKYRGKFFKDGSKWVQLVELKVSSGNDTVARHADAMVDYYGNVWWILDELEPALAAGKIKSLDELSTTYNVFGYC